MTKYFAKVKVTKWIKVPVPAKRLDEAKDYINFNLLDDLLAINPSDIKVNGELEILYPFENNYKPTAELYNRDGTLIMDNHVGE